jgi:acetone carboxylase gamma subunit
MAEVTKEIIGKMVDAKISWDELLEVMRGDKEADRFRKYIEVVQSRVDWDEKILLPIAAHLYIVQKNNGARVVKCDCGHEFSDYRENWKLGALIYIRATKDTINEIYPICLSG